MEMLELHMGDMSNEIPNHIGEMITTVLEEKLMFSLSTDMLDLARPEIRMMQEYFKKTKHYPEQLITQNKKLMQQVYMLVPQEIWTMRVVNLQIALQSSRNSEAKRRSMVTQSPPIVDILPWVLDQLNHAFLEKYEELMLRVTEDFSDFFPYRIHSTNQKVMVFEKMHQVELMEYVMKQF